MDNADSVYDRTKPWQSLQERQVGESLTVATIPDAVLALQAPPAPVVRPLFPPRFGYDREALSIDDVFEIASRFPDPANSPGALGGYSGTSRPTLGEF